MIVKKIVHDNDYDYKTIAPSPKWLILYTTTILIYNTNLPKIEQQP
jgi:hypothetical protein